MQTTDHPPPGAGQAVLEEAGGDESSYFRYSRVEGARKESTLIYVGGGLEQQRPIDQRNLSDLHRPSLMTGGTPPEGTLYRLCRQDHRPARLIRVTAPSRVPLLRTCWRRSGPATRRSKRPADGGCPRAPGPASRPGPRRLLWRAPPTRRRSGKASSESGEARWRCRPPR